MLFIVLLCLVSFDYVHLFLPLIVLDGHREIRRGTLEEHISGYVPGSDTHFVVQLYSKAS